MEYWRSANPIQRRIAVNLMCCVSFHEMPFFDSFPNLAAARILYPSGDDKVILLRDAAYAAKMLEDFDSKLAWHSPLFWSAFSPIKRAVGEMMTIY